MQVNKPQQNAAVSHKDSAVYTKTAQCFEGFYNNIQCGSGTYIIVLCVQRWDYQEVCAVVGEKQDISLLWPYIHTATQISWASAHFCDIVT